MFHEIFHESFGGALGEWGRGVGGGGIVAHHYSTSYICVGIATHRSDYLIIYEAIFNLPQVLRRSTDPNLYAIYTTPALLIIRLQWVRPSTQFFHLGENTEIYIFTDKQLCFCTWIYLLIKTIVVKYKKWIVLINYINMRYTCRLRKTHEKCVKMSHFSYQNNWKEIFGDRVNWDIYNELPKQTKIEIKKNIYII